MKDKVKLILYCEKLATDKVKKVNLNIWFNATCLLGINYCNQTNFIKARELLEPVSKPEFKGLDLHKWCMINQNLGQMYHKGDGLEQPNYQKAKEFFECIATVEVLTLYPKIFLTAALNLTDIEKLNKEKSADSVAI